MIAMVDYGTNALRYVTTTPHLLLYYEYSTVLYLHMFAIWFLVAE